jgi:hypothetical protein
VAVGDAEALNQPVYKVWLAAKSEGYRGLSVKLGAFGRLNVTTPPPLVEKDAALVAVRGMPEEQHEAVFTAFLSQLVGAMRKRGVALPAAATRRSNGRASPKQPQSPNQFSTPARSSPKRSSPTKTSRRRSRSPSPASDTDDVPRESPVDMQKRLQRQDAEARVAERRKRVEERAIAAAKREAEFAAAQVMREAAKGSPSEEVAVDPPGQRSLELLEEMRRAGKINAAQYEQARIKIKLSTDRTTGEVEPEPQAALLVGRRSPKLIVPDLEPARKIVWPEATESEPSRWSLPMSGSPERVRDPTITAAPAAPAAHDRLRPIIHAGPALCMEPFSCQFEQPAEFSCELGPDFDRHRGRALICVLRRVHSSSASTGTSCWEPLASSETLRLGKRGRCSVRLHQLGEVQLLWFSSVEKGLLTALTEMLAQAVLSGLARNRAEPDAAFRERFRLGCVAIVEVDTPANGAGRAQLTGDKNATDALEADVRKAVFEVAERREKEARERAAARAAEAAEGAAAAAARAALPGQLREAAKEGKLEDYEADKEKLQGVASLLKMGVPVDGVDDKGYTALYVATMYQRANCVDHLLKAKAEVDKPNNNDVTPLMAAARDGYTEIVKLLLAAGANHFQVDEFGRTADSLADEKGFAETATVVKEWAEAHPK